MTPTTEDLLTSPAGFGLVEATPVQRARCRIGDGIPMGEKLATDPDVLMMVGGGAALKELPSEQGIAPDVVVDLSSIRSAKTMIAVCRSIRASQIVNVDGLKVGEIPRLIFASVKLDRAKVAFRMARGLMTERPALRPLLVDETADSLMVRHPSGRLIEIACVAGGRAASGFVGDWSAGIVADEAPRMLGRDEGVTNLDDIMTAIRGRLLPRAQIQLIGSPWSPSGTVYELVQEHWRAA